MATTPATTWRSWPAVVDPAVVDPAALREAAAPLVAACVAHPFVRGLGDGSLPPAVFARWIVQDWAYLVVYAEVLERLAAAAPSPAARARWGELATFTRDEELSLHRAFAARFDVGEHDLAAPPWPATVAYTGFVQRAAAASYGAGVAAITPCGVGYLAVARALADAGPPADPRYAAWVAGYTDPAFAEAVAFMEAELAAAEEDAAALRAAYLEGARHELAFWDQLWHGPAITAP